MGEVVVWKSCWLPGSETFIRHQMDALVNWTPRPLGLRRQPSPLARESDILLGRPGPRGGWEERLLTFCGWHPRLAAYLKSLQPDLIHIHFASEARGVDLIARRLGIPYVVTVHGNDVTEAPRRPGFMGYLYRRSVARVLRGAAHVIAVSDFTKAQAVALGASEPNCSVAHVGIPVPDRVDRKPGYDVVFVGRLVPVKGVEHLLRAVASAERNGNRKISVGIAGDGPERDKLVLLAQQLDVQADFLGMLDGPAIHTLLAGAKVFVGPSVTTPTHQTEGFGLVFLEAAAHGLPVASYRSGGIPEAVQDGITGLLAPEGDLTHLAANISALLEDADLRDRLGLAGRARVIRDFDITRTTARLESIYAAASHGTVPRLATQPPQ